MFWNFWRKKEDPSRMFDMDPATTPHGVPLGHIRAMLNPGTIRSSIQGDTLFAEVDGYKTVVKVSPPPADAESEDPIQAVVRVTTAFPSALADSLRDKGPEFAGAFNAMSSLGAITEQGGRLYIGARLTMFEEENSWGTLQLPLLAFSVIGGASSIFRSVAQVLEGGSPPRGRSSWTEKDLVQVHQFMTRACACTVGGGFTAEFPLEDGAYSAALGHEDTALFQILLNEPHPLHGPGLFCLLQFPTCLPSDDAVQQICAKLNQLEMSALDAPPHFGAWCPGRKGTNVSYVQFFPNALHSVSGLPLNAAIWAMARAQWGAERLREMGQEP
ncbi:MAG: hypothetical protein RIS45_960 [Planctomycetota bacterium]